MVAIGQVCPEVTGQVCPEVTGQVCPEVTGSDFRADLACDNYYHYYTYH